ncbi:MAG TPA: aldehyde dehydrogenase family protein [Acidobacteriota bacterium]
MTIYRNLIDGEWVLPAGAREVPNLNPADTRDVIGTVKLSTRAQTRAAIEAAERAFPAWRATPAPQRARILLRAHRILDERTEEVARALTREEGKVLAEARGEVKKTVNILEFMAGQGMRLDGATRPSELPSTFAYTVRQPLGVVAAITPWNFPVSIPFWKLAPALVAGNTAVFKPATLTPECGRLVAEILTQSGLPNGVLNLVYGAGAEVGDELVTHPAIRAVSFTGSNEVGAQLYARGAAGLKKVQCEMGGKNPLVVLEDADLDLAASGCAMGAFGSTGQRCTATSRAIVVESVADDFVAKVVELARQLRAGPGLEPGFTLGPQVDENQLNVVLKYIEVGREEGATLICGGERITAGDLRHGFFVAPTVFDRVQPPMRIAREEIFGPVLAVLRVRDDEQALAVANQVDYGLTASIYSGDPNRILRFIDAIEVGIVHVNSATVGGEAQLPFGGVKATGVGHREMGDAALDFYTELKTVYYDYTGKARESKIY